MFDGLVSGDGKLLQVAMEPKPQVADTLDAANSSEAHPRGLLTQPKRNPTPSTPPVWPPQVPRAISSCRLGCSSTLSSHKTVQDRRPTSPLSRASGD